MVYQLPGVLVRSRGLLVSGFQASGFQGFKSGNPSPSPSKCLK